MKNATKFKKKKKKNSSKKKNPKFTRRNVSQLWLWSQNRRKQDWPSKIFHTYQIRPSSNIQHIHTYIHLMFFWPCIMNWLYINHQLLCADYNLIQAVYIQATRNSHGEWQYHMLHVYNCILLKMSTWGSEHVEEINISWININQCTKVGD